MKTAKKNRREIKCPKCKSTNNDFIMILLIDLLMKCECGHQFMKPVSEYNLPLDEKAPYTNDPVQNLRTLNKLGIWKEYKTYSMSEGRLQRLSKGFKRIHSVKSKGYTYHYFFTLKDGEPTNRKCLRLIENPFDQTVHVSYHQAKEGMEHELLLFWLPDDEMDCF